MRLAAAVLLIAAAIAAPATAAPTAIPQTDTDTPFFGAPATQNPLVSPDPPRHPFMAPNGNSNLHVDAYQTDANQGPGPLGRSSSVISTFYSADCASITFDARGRIVTICVGLQGPTLRMLDPRTLDELASFPLPGRQPGTSVGIFNDFAGGGYFYLDNTDRAVLPTTTRHIYVVKEVEPAGFALEHDYDLSAVVPTGDKIFSALPDFSGRVWFATTKGRVGFVEPASGAVHLLATGEEIENSFAIDETGGIYLVTIKALYRFAAVDGKPVASWRAEYPNSGIAKPGQVDAGSGTTPTITPRGMVAITDNADPMNVLLYDRRSGAEVCRVPVFHKGSSATDQSLVSFGDALIAENNYGYSGPAATEQGATTTPGVWRVDYDPAAGACGVTWRSDEISPTVVPKVSLANGLLYVYTKPAGRSKDPWYLTAIDARTGVTVYKRLAGDGLGFNNNYAPVTLGADGTAFLGVLGGMVAIRDAVPPPGAAATVDAPVPAAGSSGSGSCRRLPGPRAARDGRALRVTPSGVSSATLSRRVVLRGRALTQRVLSRRRLRRATTIRAARRLHAGTYVLALHSGADRRLIALRRRHARFSVLPAIQVVSSCARAELSGPLFGRAGLHVRVVPSADGRRITVRAARTRAPHRSLVAHASGRLSRRLHLGRGTWRLSISVDGHRVGTLTARRP